MSKERADLSEGKVGVAEVVSQEPGKREVSSHYIEALLSSKGQDGFFFRDGSLREVRLENRRDLTTGKRPSVTPRGPGKTRGVRRATRTCPDVLFYRGPENPILARPGVRLHSEKCLDENAPPATHGQGCKPRISFYI